MSSGSGQTPVTQTQTSDPWSGAQPHLQHTMQSAEQYFNNNYGYQPYGGQVQAPIDPNTQYGLQSTVDIASGEPYGSPGVNAARAFGQQMLGSGGLVPGQTAAIGQLQDIYNRAKGQQNPYLQDILTASNRQISDKINAGMSGAGRYGSGAHTDVMARAMAEASNPILAQDYAQRQQQQQALQQAISGIYGTGQESAGKWAQLMPSLDEARYAGAQKYMDVGNVYQNRAQQEIANQMALYNAQQAYPWEQLQRYQGIISGTGALGGTKVTASTPYTPSTLQRVGGGALAGAGLGSMFGPMGAGVGAAGGGLLGLL